MREREKYWEGGRERVNEREREREKYCEGGRERQRE